MKKKILFILLCIIAFTTYVRAADFDYDYDAAYEIVAPGGNFYFSRAIKPTNDIEDYSFTSDFYYYKNYNKESYDKLQALLPNDGKIREVNLWVHSMNEDYSQAELVISISEKVRDTGEYDYEQVSSDQRTVSLTWQKTDPEIKKLADAEATRIAAFMKDDDMLHLKMSDLNFINFLNTISGDMSIFGIDNAIYFVDEYNQYFGNTGFTYLFDAQAGVVNPLLESGWGQLTIVYNGVKYAALEGVGLASNNVIYIPENTENTKEAYLAAAQKRIDY